MTANCWLIAIGVAVQGIGHASEQSPVPLTEWTERGAVLFAGEVPESVWSIQGADRILGGRRVRDVLVLTTPRVATSRSCKSEAIRVSLPQGRTLREALMCTTEPCEQRRSEYAAVRTPGEDLECPEIGVERYFLVRTPFEEQATVEAYDLAECIRTRGSAVVSSPACGFRIRSDIHDAEKKLLEKLPHLRLVEIGIEKFRERGRMAYAFSYSDSKDFLRPSGTIVWLTFTAPHEAEIGTTAFIAE